MQGNAQGDPSLIQQSHPNLIAAAEQVRAVAASSNVCDLSAPGVYQAVFNFQGLWNSLGGNTISVDGKYGTNTSLALASLYDSSVTLPDPCTSFTGVPPSGGGGGTPPAPAPGGGGGGITPTPSAPLATTSTAPAWVKWLIGGLIVAAVGYLAWALAHKPKHRAKVRHVVGRVRHRLRRRR